MPQWPLFESLNQVSMKEISTASFPPFFQTYQDFGIRSWVVEFYLEGFMYYEVACMCSYGEIGEKLSEMRKNLSPSFLGKDNKFQNDRCDQIEN